MRNTALLIGLLALGCGGISPAPFYDPGDDASADTFRDTSSDSAITSDEDSGTADTQPEPRRAGQPCWNQIFGGGHPNFGLPDCEDELTCIGDADEAWCTKKCQVTGQLNKADLGLENWCCGELADPCKPERYWLPASMSFYCIPREAELAKPCSLDTKWPGENPATSRRCRPVCNGKELDHETSCAERDGKTFCTFLCDIKNGDQDCALEPAFGDIGGCCGEMMGGLFCLTPELCV